MFPIAFGDAPIGVGLDLRNEVGKALFGNTARGQALLEDRRQIRIPNTAAPLRGVGRGSHHRGGEASRKQHPRTFYRAVAVSRSSEQQLDPQLSVAREVRLPDDRPIDRAEQRVRSGCSRTAARRRSTWFSTLYSSKRICSRSVVVQLRRLREVDVELIERRPPDLDRRGTPSCAPRVVRPDDEVRLGAARGDREAQHRDDAGVVHLRDAVLHGADDWSVVVVDVRRSSRPSRRRRSAAGPTAGRVLNSHMPATSQPPASASTTGSASVQELAVAAERQVVDAGDRDAVPAIALVGRPLHDAIDVGDQRVGGVVAADLVAAAVLLDHLRPACRCRRAMMPSDIALVDDELRRVVPDLPVVAIELGDPVNCGNGRLSS